MDREFKYGDRVLLKCKEGYFKSGLGVYQCKKGNRWSGGITCSREFSLFRVTVHTQSVLTRQTQSLRYLKTNARSLGHNWAIHELRVFTWHWYTCMVLSAFQLRKTNNKEKKRKDRLSFLYAIDKKKRLQERRKIVGLVVHLFVEQGCTLWKFNLPKALKNSYSKITLDFFFTFLLPGILHLISPALCLWQNHPAI